MTLTPLVHVVDDDADIRESLQMLLSSVGIHVVTYPDADTFLASNVLDDEPADAPACMLLDMRMPGVGGMALLERIRQSGARLPVIVITGHGDIPMSVRAMKLGAVDFITKPFNHQKLLDLVQHTLRNAARTPAGGSGTLDPRLARQRWEVLTPREREVFEQIVAGSPNKVIGINLGISIRTVETHRARIMEKLQARSLVDLVMLKIALQ